MSRTRRVVLTLIVCLCAAVNARAQAPPDGWVVLPVDEYRALRARANPETPPPTAPPVDATLTRVDYELHLDPSSALGAGGDTVAGRAVLTIDVLRDGWVKVPIPAGLMVRDARLDGQPVALIEGPPAHVVLSRTAQGELRTLTLLLPKGYEFQSVTGNTLEESAPLGSEVILTVGNTAARTHQFLVTLERAHAGGTFDFETGIVSLKDVQRERGEIAIQGVGTMDLTAVEQPGMHRIDVRELNSSLHELARHPILSAFRYQRPAEATPPSVGVTVKRFEDAGVLAAAADRATATTLVTREGRALTEVILQLRNRSQPFLKVQLPAGATIVSVDLAGKSVKPASGADGTRIPLMRAGLSTTSPYRMSFVYVHAGTPFEKKGDIDMALPKMDIPIGVVEWEVFVPEQYRARAIDGNVIDAKRFNISMPMSFARGYPRNTAPARLVTPYGVLPGQIRGRVADSSGGYLPGATVEIRIGSYSVSTVSDANG